MKCKNCGMKIGENENICPNCGAMIDNRKIEYVLSTDDDSMIDISSGEDFDNRRRKNNKKSNFAIRFLSLLLTLIIIAGGAFYYFTNIYNPPSKAPELSFKTGSGIINDDEKVIFVLLEEKSNIEFIHGVNLYDYDKTDKSADKKEPVSRNYEYTKNIDSSFRAIFFKTYDLDVKGGENTYTFEMTFSFNGSDETFTYLQPVSFEANISGSASDLIFDHSQEQETTTAASNETQTTEAQTTTASAQTSSSDSVDFIYNSYWFTQPVQTEEEYIISAIKFNKDNSYVSTNYYKNGSASWEITTYNGKYKIENGFAVLDNGEATESTYYKIDTQKQSLYEEEDGKTVSTLTSRKYNSIKNAEDFFGI
ncbi:MAG: zinc ribbon domain-containing protein [Eubacterium sp.]|nr:zinc ribbon domain-containing protein [Eubacterium sp.]